MEWPLKEWPFKTAEWPFKTAEWPFKTAADRFEAFYERHQAPLFAYLVGRVGDRELALDLLQETMTRAWRFIGTLDKWEPDRQRYWLMRVGRNLAVDSYRRRERAVSTDPLPEQASSPTTDPAVRTEVREQFEALGDALHGLDEDLRTALLLQVVGELNSTEIGRIMERPSGTVRYLISTARRRLVQAIASQAPRGGGDRA